MPVPSLDRYAEAYRAIDDKYNSMIERIEMKPEDAVELLIAFPRSPDAPKSTTNIDFHELTAICPWTRMPDQGSIYVEYVPGNANLLLELKSFKYYLLAFRDMHITQEHLAELIYGDLVAVLAPSFLKVTLDYMPRGGLHTTYVLPQTSA